jgi:hypothetical protein
MSAHRARRVDAAAFAFAMLAFCWWLHAVTVVLGWLSRRQTGTPLPVFAVEAAAVLLVALGLAVLAARPVFGLIRGAMRAAADAALLLGGRWLPNLSSAARRAVSGGSR